MTAQQHILDFYLRPAAMTSNCRHAPDAAFAELRTLYEGDGRLRVPGRPSSIQC
jgi:hypothetical protein